MLSSPPRTVTTRSCLIAGKKRNLSSPVKSKEREDNNNQTPAKSARKQLARTPTKVQNNIATRDEATTFARWFQHTLDDDRHNFTLYLADEVILEWFGRTVRTRKKVSGFMEFEMQCSKHNFLTSVRCSPFTARADKAKRTIPESSQNIELAVQLEVPGTPTAMLKSSLNCLTVRGSSIKKRHGLRSDSVSPEKRPCSPQWENNVLKHCLDTNLSASEKKRAKMTHGETMDIDRDVDSDSGRGRSEAKSRPFFRKLRFDDATDEGIGEIGEQGDAEKKKFPTTPVKCERGQGDGLPTTSKSNITDARSLLIANLPRKYVECNGFIEFVRSKNKRCIDSMKWERKCKVQVSYTEDPVNIGEYTIWTIIYSDDIKCKRNLLAAFEEVERNDARKKLM